MKLAKKLVELKLVDRRISKRTDEIDPVAVKQNNKLMHRKLTQGQFERDATACWHSLRGLLERRRNVKCSIVVDNATTDVDVCGEQYTLAEAIKRRQMMKVERNIIAETMEKLSKVKFEVEEIERRNEAKLIHVRWSSKVRQLTAADHDTVAVPLKKNNDTSLVDPLSCEKMLTKFEYITDPFLADVDVCMSVANATTTISVARTPKTRKEKYKHK